MNSNENTPTAIKQKQKQQGLFQAEITGGFGLASPIPDSLSFRATADPIEDASQLVFAYTASKQQTARNRRLEDENNDIDSHGSDQEHSQVGDETTPLDMVRYAMLQLETLSKNEILDDQHTIPNVTSMLQGIEEYLENAAATENRGKLSYSQVKGSGQHLSPPRTNDPYTPIIDRSSYPLMEPLSNNNPNKFLNMSMLQNDTSIVVDLNRTSASIAASRRSITNTEQKKLKSVYMDNQLDLNENETEYYENMIQKLCEDLEKLGDEKNALDEQRLFLISKSEEASNQLRTFKESYELERITTGHLEEQIKEMTSRMNDDQKKIYYAKEEVKTLQAQVSQLTAELSDSEYRRLEESKLTAAKLDAQAKQIKILHSSIDDLQESESLAKAKIPSSEDPDVLQISIDIGELRAEAEELRAMVLTLEADREALVIKKKKMELNNAEKCSSLEALIEDLEAGMEECQSENDRLKEALNDQKRDSLDDSGSGGGSVKYDVSNSDVNKVKELTESLRELSEQVALKDVVIQTLEVKLDHLSQVNTELNCKIIQYENSIALLEGSTLQADGPTSQLETDTEDLPSILKDVRRQLVVAQSEKEAAFEDNARLVTMLDTLKLRVNGSDSDMLQYDDLFGGLSTKLEEKDQLIDELNEQLANFQIRSAQNSSSRLNTPDNKFISGSSVAEKNADLTNAYLGIGNSSTPGSVGRDASAQFSLTINAGDNDSDDGNEDDEADMDNDSVSFLMVPPPPPSTTTEAQEKDSATVEELRQTIVLREQQVKAQISQLQYLQDSLSEQKSINQNLKSQSVSLKASLEEAKEKLSKVSNQSDDYRHLLADAERRSSSLQDMVSELTARNIDMKLFGEENMISENGDVNESGESSGSAKKATAAKTSRLEAEVNELNFQLRSAQKQKEDLQLEFEKLQMRYQTKSKQLEEAISEGQYLREELDGRLQELDRLKLNEMKFDTSFKLKELDNESQIHFLRERNISLEGTVQDLEESIQAKDEEIAEKGDIIISLREVLEKLGEKEDATEELLSELKAEREGHEQTISDLQNNLEKKSDEVSALQEQCEEMAVRLGRASQSSSEREQDLEAENRTLLSEIEELKYRLETAQEDSHARLTELSAKIQAVMTEKATVKSELTSTEELTHKLEQSLHETEKSALFHLRVCQDICDGVAFFDNRMKSLEQSVSKQLTGKVKRLEDKVSAIKSKSEYAIKVLMSNKELELNKRLTSENDLGILEDLSAQQRGTTTTFIAVETGGEAPELKQYELPQQMWTEENSLSEEGNGAAQFEEESIYSASNSQYSTASILAMGNEVASNASGANNIRDRANSSRPFVHYNDDRAVLLQRLEEAERRALSLSSEGARAFARSTKHIAYLEGECTRLKTLVDHLRLVNMKLTGDLKAAHHEGVKVKTLEHRLKVVSQEEQMLQSKLLTAESAVLKKEKELLATMDARLGAAESRNPSQVELIEYVETSDKFRALQEKFRAALAELEELKYQQSERDRTYQHEVEQLSVKLKSSEAEKSNRGRAIEKLESEMMTLKSLLNDRDSSYKQAEVTISILQQEVKMSKDAHQSIVRELTDENLDKQSRIKVLEGKLQYLKTQVSELETSFIKNEEETVVRSLKRATIEEENRHFRLLLESQKSELAAGAAQVDELLLSVDGLKLELSSTKDQMLQLQTILMPDLQKKLQVSDEQLSTTNSELEAARRELRINHDLIVSSRDALVKSESSLQNMQTEFLVLRTNEQVLQSDNNSLRNENEYLQRQCEELGKQWMAGSQDIQVLRLTLQEQGDSNQSLMLRFNDAESKRKLAEAKVEQLEQLEFEFANEIRSVCESVIVAGQATNSNVTLTETTPIPTSKSGVDPFCSPPLVMVAQTPPTVSRFSLLSPAKEREGQVALALTDGGDERESLNTAFPHIFNSVAGMKSKLQAMVQASKSSFDALLAAKGDRDDLRYQLDVLKEKFLKVSIEKDSLEGNASALQTDLSTAKVRLAVLEEEKKALLSDSDHFSQKLFAVLKDLDSCLLDALSTANDLTAGIVPLNSINTNVSSSSGSASDSQGLQLLWASRSSAEIFGRRNDSPVDLLQSFVREVSSGTSYFNSITKALVSEYQKKSLAVEKLESMLESKEAYWTNERSQFIQQKSSIETELEQLLNEKQKLNSTQEAHKLETDRLVGQLKELKSKNAELEVEFKTTCEINAELRATLSEAEGIYIELNSRSRSLQSEVDSKTEELGAMGQALEDARRRLLDGQIAVERHGAAATRLKAEKDALDNVRRSLESELERSRLELRQIQEHSKSLELDSRATFEVEKLLAALANSLDQVMLPSSTSSAVVVSVPSDIQIVSLSDRVDAALRRLQALRGWAREEQRAKRILEQQAAALTEDLSLAQESSSDLTLQLKKLQKSSADKERELREKANEGESQLQELSGLQKDVEKFKKDLSSVTAQYEESRAQYQSLTLTLQRKEGELSCLAIDLDTKGATIVKLQEQLASLKQQLEDANSESAHRQEQLKAAKLHSDRIMATVHQIERSADEDRKEREVVEKKLIEAEQSSISSAKVKARAVELEQSLQRAQEEVKALNYSKIQGEESNRMLVKELESSKRKINSLEGRINSILLEQNSFADEIAETRKRIAHAKEQAEQERAQRIQSEAAIETLRRLEEKRPHPPLVLQSHAHSEEVAAAVEEEKRNLKLKINELKISCEEKEAQRVAEINDRKKLEKDIRQLQHALEKRNSEINSSAQSSSAFRAEGRRARKAVQAALQQVRDIFQMILVDAQLPLQEKDLWTQQRGKGASDFNYEESLSQGLSEALGVNELSTALDSLRTAVESSLKGSGTVGARSKAELLNANSRLTEEVAQLRQQVKELETRKVEAIAQLKEEKLSLQQQLSEQRRYDSKNPHLMHQIATLEDSLRQERERKERALAEIDGLKERLDKLGRDVVSSLHSKTTKLRQDGNYEQQHLSAELTALRVQKQEAQAELAAVTHHRTVLRETIDQLDRRLAAHVETISDLKLQGAGQHAASWVDDRDGNEQLVRQVARYKAKASAMEELASIYRTSVTALYADGSSYGAAQFGPIAQEDSKGSKVGGVGAGWIERELAAVKRSYEEEVRVLDAEVSELRAKLRQTTSYSAELRRRYEDSMKSVFRSNSGAHGHQSEDLLRQLEQLRTALESSHADIDLLEQELARLRSEGRKRHAQLLDELGKALQGRDAAVGSLLRLETYCQQNNWDIKQLSNFQQFQSDAYDSTAAHKATSNSYAGTNHSFSVFPESTQFQQLQQQQQAISTLMRGLVEADHELVEAERRAARHSRSSQQGHVHSHKHRSSSRGRTTHSNHREKDIREDANIAPITVRDLTAGTGRVSHSGQGEAAASPTSSAQLLRSSNWTAPSSSIHQVPVSSSQAGPASTNSSTGSGSLRVSKASKGYY